MTMGARTALGIPTDEDVIDTVERSKHEHPEVGNALRVLRISDQAYPASVLALNSRRLNWSNTTNETATQLPQTVSRDQVCIATHVSSTACSSTNAGERRTADEIRRSGPVSLHSSS